MNAPLPPPEKSSLGSLLLSALVHLLLLGALFFGMQWKNQGPPSVAVEVWRAPPAPVLPPAPEPEAKPEPRIELEPKLEPTPPPKPDITVKDEKKPKEEAKKPEPKKEEPKKLETKKEEPRKVEPKREEPDWKKELAREERQLEQHRAAQERASREADMRAQLGAEQASSARSQGLAAYVARVRGKIRGNIVLPAGIRGNPEAVFKVTQLPSGEVIGVRLSRSSGHKALDEAIERAILKSSPLPKPDQPDLFYREFDLKYRPQDE